MISYKKSLSILNKNKIKISNESVISENSLNRVSAENVYSKYNYPSGNNSAFDGYAIKSSETNKASKNKKIKFKILRTIAAGQNPNTKNEKFSCVEIMTGAILPKQFNTIIPIESSKLVNLNNKKYLLIEKKIKKNEHVRFLGSDYKKNQLIISKGELINSSHILAFKTLGLKKVLVKRKPNILFYSTGNELSNNVNIKNWMVRNSNNFYLKSLSDNFLFNYFYGGLLRDNNEKKLFNSIKKNFHSKFDIIVTSGAVSAGKFDFVPNVVKKFKPNAIFKGVKIRPGKPILFCNYKNKNKSFFGLPGNPISSAACFRFFVFPYLQKILDLKLEKPFFATLKNNFEKKKNFTRFVKAKLILNKNSKLTVEILKGQESFRIKSFVDGNVWAVLKDGKSSYKKGDEIECYYSSFLNKF